MEKGHVMAVAGLKNIRLRSRIQRWRRSSNSNTTIAGSCKQTDIDKSLDTVLVMPTRFRYEFALVG